MTVQRIGDYQIYQSLSPDEWGARLQVEHAKTGERALLRVFSSQVQQNPSRMAAIHHAPELAHSFHHPHASLPRELIEIEGSLCLLSADAAGRPLCQWLQEKPSPWPAEQALPLLRTLAQVLDAAHTAGVFHGHLHPGNIFLDEDGRVTLSDWGLVWSPEPDSGLLQSLAEGEHALFLAPELLAGNQSPGPAGDRYALATLAYHLLSGSWPYPQEDASERLLAQLTQPPADPRSVAPHLDDIQAQTLLQGLARDPTDRYATAADMIAALEEAFIRPWQKVGIQLVAIPPGPFLSGQGETAQMRQLPAFSIMRFPVTVAQFAAFVADTGYATLAEREGWGLAYDGARWVKTPAANWRHPQGGESNIEGKENHPVVQIALEDARAFCKWAGLQLPDEWQWEKAARGDDGRLYPWGSDWRPGCCHHAGDGLRHTMPVDAFPCGASPYHVHDMVGNVWEWTSSPFEPKSPYLVLRGGGWPHARDIISTTFRYYALPDYRSDALGFRCVHTSSKEQL